MPQLIEVACLVLRDPNRRVLSTQRPAGKRLGGFWEFPGGKIEAGESAAVALRREILEELNLQVGELRPLQPVEHLYDFGTIRLVPLLSECAEQPAIVLYEHVEARWLALDELDSVEWAPADLPILEQLRGT